MNFSEHHLILLLFRLILFIIVVCNAYSLSKKQTAIKLLDFYPTIIGYTLYAGLRWGRGIDYNIYYWIYQDIINGYGRENNEPLFELLVKLFGGLGLEWQCFVIFMSFFLIFSGCFFLKYFHKELLFLLPFFVFSIGLAENLMRWYLGLSFILIGLYYLLHNQQTKFFILALLAFFIHYGLILDIFVFYVVWLFFKRPLAKPMISICLYLIIYFFFSPEFMGRFANTISMIDMGTRFLSYQENAKDWLTGNAHDDVRDTLSLFNIVSSIYIIYIGYFHCKKIGGKSIISLYNWALIGLIFRPAAVQIEIAMRINAPFVLMTYLIAAYMCYNILFTHKKSYSSFIISVTIVFLLYNVYSLVFAPVLHAAEHSTYFIWDSEGRKVLPLYIF